MPTHSGLDCFCHSHLGHNTTGRGRGESCKWSCGWGRRGNKLSELHGCPAPALAPPTLTNTCIPMSPLARTRSEEPVNAVGRQHAHGSQADGSRERIPVSCRGHRGVLHWPLEAPHRWRPRLGLRRAQPSAPVLVHTAPAGSATPFCLTGHFPFSPQ